MISGVWSLFLSLPLYSMQQPFKASNQNPGMAPHFPQQENQVLRIVCKSLCGLTSVTSLSLAPTTLPSLIQLQSHWHLVLWKTQAYFQCFHIKLLVGYSSTWSIIPPGVIRAHFSTSFKSLHKYDLLYSEQSWRLQPASVTPPWHCWVPSPDQACLLNEYINKWGWRKIWFVLWWNHKQWQR